jgi:hypothetical protein
MGRLGIERHHLFELMALLGNYVSLANTDLKRFLQLAEDELQADAASRSQNA